MIVMLARTFVLAVLATGATVVRADAPPDGTHALEIKVGEAVPICTTGTVVCPAGAGICDDPSVAEGEFTDQGLVFRGKRPGTTLCSARDNSGLGASHLYRITVTRPDEPGRGGDRHDGSR